MFSPVIKKKRNGKYGNNHWFSYSSKIKRNVYLYSDLEFDHWILVEFDHEIVEFCEQPKHVEEYVDGEWINTIFDMWVRTKSGEEKFIEVKYACELDPVNERFSMRSFKQVQSQQKWCQAHGYYYEVHTDDDVYKNKLLISNYKKILPYIDNRKVHNEIIRKKILDFLQNEEKQTIRSIEANLKNYTKHEIREVIYNLLFNGRLDSTIDKVNIGEKLEVWLP